MLLYIEHDYAYYDSCADSYAEDGEYYENIQEFLAPQYSVAL